jgi:hypothetical protein
VTNINRILMQLDVKQRDWRWARQVWRHYRVSNGWGPKAPLLTQPDGNVKYLKDQSVVTFGLALAQARTAVSTRVTVWHLDERGHRIGFHHETIRINVCPFSTPACRAGCVADGGNGRYDRTRAARQLKTRFMLEHPDAFFTLLAYELDQARARYGRKLRVRLNTFSDIRFEEVVPWLLRSGGRQHIRFYDYTKDWGRTPPANYRLTLSASERTSDVQVGAAVASGRTVAVVFSTPRTKPLPADWAGVAVIDGDKSDNRQADPAGVVVGLRAKGRMRGDRSGMVRTAA